MCSTDNVYEYAEKARCNEDQRPTPKTISIQQGIHLHHGPKDDKDNFTIEAINRASMDQYAHAAVKRKADAVVSQERNLQVRDHLT